MAHNHGHHGHHHGHHHHHTGSEKNIAIAFFLNLGFTIIEIIGGLWTNSTAILADAIHDLGDSLAIGLAWALQTFSKKKPNEQFTYGYRRFSLLAAFINACVLVVGSIWILFESIPRLFNPEMPLAEGMVGLAILGIIVNGAAAWRLSKGESQSEKILNWHLIEDVMGWVAVLIVSLILLVYPIAILDPILSIAFTLFIVVNVIRNLKQTILLFLQSVPDETLVENLTQYLKSLPQIEDLHHLHLWSLDGERHVLTVHLKLASPLDAAEQLALKNTLHENLHQFDLAHTTIELELPNETCRDHNIPY